MSYQSYKYGSNGIHNSCHQDTFLELIYHSFKRHFDCSPNTKLTEGLKQLIEAFVLREKGKFHESKMTLWKWLRDKTESGFTYYAYGKEASLISIIYRLLESMPGELRDTFSIKTNYSYTCGIDKSHNSCRSYTHSVFPISSDDVLETHLFLKSNDFDVIQVIQHKLTLNNFTPASKCSVLTKIDASDICTTDSDCTVIHNPNTCGATLLCSTSVTNTPDIFFVGYTHNSSKGYTPNLDKENTNIEVNNCTYRLSGIVYLKSHHYWCEVYSTQKHFKKGWFAHNGLWNNGKATFVGLKPLILEKESLYLLMFEQIKTKHPTILSDPCVTFYKSIHPNNQEIIKEIVQQHKCLLSLSDNKAKLANIKAILQYHNIPIKSNMKIADLSDLLLQHCNTTTTVPITFVSDCSIDNYTEASKRDNFIQHELADFVPVTFINDSNMNTLQVQTGEDISETINLK